MHFSYFLVIGLSSAMVGCGGSGDVPAVLAPPVGPLPSAGKLSADFPVFLGSGSREVIYTSQRPNARFCSGGDVVLLRKNNGQLWQLAVSDAVEHPSDCPYAVGTVSGRDDSTAFVWNSPNLEIRTSTYTQYTIEYPDEAKKDSRGFSSFKTLDGYEKVNLSFFTAFDTHPSLHTARLSELEGEWRALTNEHEDYWLRVLVNTDGSFLLTDASTGDCHSRGILRPRDSSLLDVEMTRPCDSKVVTATGLATLANTQRYGTGVSFYIAVSSTGSGGGIPFGLVAQRSLPENLCFHRPNACRTVWR